MTPDLSTTPPFTSKIEPKMSDEQIAILVQTVSNVSAALDDVPRDVADRIREQQEDVADTRRKAQVNEDLLRMRVS